MKPQLRFYSFTNYYLSSIQKGIQTGHAIAEMANFEKINLSASHPETDFERWSRVDRTIIVLNGGNCKSLEKIYAELPYLLNTLPVKFHEDEESLNGALTCVGVIIPEMYWNRENNHYWDYEEVVKVRKFLEKYPLAV